MVTRDQFRSDLYYCLNVFPILLPPLRARREDIEPLVMHFAEKFGRRIGKHVQPIPEPTMSALTNYQWPGNIRELQNLIERAVILLNDGVLPNPLATSVTRGMVALCVSACLSARNRFERPATGVLLGWDDGRADRGSFQNQISACYFSFLGDALQAED